MNTYPRLRCAYCKRVGHVLSRCFRYMVRNQNAAAVQPVIEQMRQPIDALFAMFNSRAILPRALVTVSGHTEQAVFHTGLPYNVVSRRMYEVLCSRGVRFGSTQLVYETGATQRMLRAEMRVTVELLGRRVEVNLFAHPNELATTPTMLGVEFLERAAVVLDMANQCWSFSDDPRNGWYPFVKQEPEKLPYVL